ncbi:uncharacterized protein N7511_004870 [Penicillium nucicola]|uniref:uncharacterized protein n=1 Tax=Penicillium nucicola TaxID=1850975 RepID=UPI0025456217|nr:uncharacterized protein N7511_004870 [Penicillium nucicola]KAJ5767254.1 hypothetical protein N7511_004870 [Penicillium nucicola]
MDTKMDNSGDFLLQVPGFNAIPVDYELDVNECFAHGATDHRALRLTKTEILMLRLMEHVTDKKNWEHDIFDQKVVAQWYTDAALDSNIGSDLNYEWDINFDIDLISNMTWNWCIQELRDKALMFTQKGYILTFNADSGVCKSDLMVTSDLQKMFQDSFDQLFNQDLRHSDESTIDLVDPSLFMLAYGQTAVLSQGGRVDITKESISVPTTGLNVHVPPNPETFQEIDDPSPWSEKYQWLPCEVKFLSHEGTDVRITSYINNLDPQHSQAYAAIEKLIGLSLKPWNDVLKKGTLSRYPLRIKTFGFEAIDPDKIWGTFQPRNWKKKSLSQTWTQDTWADYCMKAKEYLALPELDQKYRVRHQEPDEPEEPDDILGSVQPWICEDWKWEDFWVKPVEWKWERLNTFKYPEAGISYTYEDWKKGKTTKPVIGKRKDCSSCLDVDHVYQSISLQDDFREKGLQVIIRVSSIDLTPAKPSFEGDKDFHVEGLLNEHIVAVARYYYDVENISDARISFQQKDDLDPYECRVGPDAMHKIFGLPPFDRNEYGPEKLQILGSVATQHGRFLAWSNTLRHKTRPFTLKDMNRPGHQRFVSLFLVDPHYRICSTRNVPAQQHDGWRDTVYDELGTSARLPQEVADVIMEQIGDWPISLAEAKRWKEESEEERYPAEVDPWEQERYDFGALIEDMEEDIVVSPSGERTLHGRPV